MKSKLLKEQKEFWSEENILADDDEVTVLRGLHGPKEYHYNVALHEPQIVLEAVFVVERGDMLVGTVQRLEKELEATARKLGHEQRRHIPV